MRNIGNLLVWLSAAQASLCELFGVLFICISAVVFLGCSESAFVALVMCGAVSRSRSAMVIVDGEGLQ